MKIIVHKGSQEIGGTCISLTEGDKTIWLDFGLPLKEGSVCLEVGKMQPQPDAVFISHVHLDHYGRVQELDERTPVYMGKLSHMLINALCDFNSHNKRLKNPVFYFKGFKRVKPVKFGPFQITPRLVDHSAPDAYAFEIRGGGKTVFYSGDLRAHGRKPNTFEDLTKRPPRNVDLMFLEGTMLGRLEEKIKTEYELELEMAEIFKRQTNISFVVSSGQNIDRVVTVIKACNHARKIPVVGIYNAWLMEQFYRNYQKTGVPNLHHFEDMEVFFDPDHKKILEEKKEYFGDFYGLVHEHHAFKKRPYDNYVMIISPKTFYANVAKKHAKSGKVNVIFSMWKEYLKRPEHLKKPGFRAIAQLKKNPEVLFHEIHTSGHASIQDLKNLVQVIEPEKLYPIHTQSPELFNDVFKGPEIVCQKDGEIFEL